MAETSCPHCRNTFTPPRTTAVYCSARCRTAAYRRRHAAVTPADPPAMMLAAVDRLIALARTIAARNRRRPKLVALMRKFVVGAEPVRSRWAAAAREP